MSAAFTECAGTVVRVTDLSGIDVFSTVVRVKCVGEGEHGLSCVCEGEQEEPGSCDGLLSPGEGAVIGPLLFPPPGPRLASGDPMRLKMQRSGFFGRTGFSGELSFCGLPGLQTLLLCFKSLNAVKSPPAAPRLRISELFL